MIALIHLVDFVFFNHHLRNLAGFAGFSLMTLGTVRDLQWASAAGVTLALGAIVVRYVP